MRIKHKNKPFERMINVVLKRCGCCGDIIIFEKMHRKSFLMLDCHHKYYCKKCAEELGYYKK